MGIRGSYASAADIDAELFGEPHQGTLSYLRERVERYAPRITEIFDGFFEDSRVLFERHNGERALRKIRQRIRQSSNPTRGDIIRPLIDLSDLQNAKPLMQRYIMANPMARRYEAEQRFDGYSDSYRNAYPGRSTWEDPDYMRAVDGMIFTDDRFGQKPSEDPEGRWIAPQNLFDTDERDLDIIEQSDVFSTWDVLEMHLEAMKKDPTSVLNESL